MIGETLSHYKIVSKLGEGGMGEVYLAEDLNLKRKVALKVMPPAVAENPERLQRFQREAEAIAALDHPNIVTIYNIEESEGRRLIVMQLVEGESLDKILPPQGLPLAKVFEIAIPLSDALAAAHERGIIHRDLKPANVMVAPNGRIKVLDFGLAKLAAEAADGIISDAGVTQAATRTATLTREGTVMGTAPYMSPEQLKGSDIDQRSDIFSLGILLYEMVTGQRPFRGDSGIDLASRILREAPTSAAEIRTDLPRHLGRIIHTCLEKDPERRYQSVKDVRNELDRLKDEIDSGTLTGVSQAVAAAPTSGVATVVDSGSAATMVSGPAQAVASGPLPTASSPSRTLWIGIAACVLVLIALGAWILGRGSQTDLTRPDTRAEELAPALASQASIAVLPFADRSPEQDQEYFSDGLTEELITVLANVPDLKVAGRSSSFSFKGQNVDLREVGSKLNVAHILEGSVRKSGEKVRVSAQLVKADDGFQLWSETFDRELDDIFQIQDEIAQSVATALQVTLLGTPSTTRDTQNGDAEAYTKTLQAQHLIRRGGGGDTEMARAFLDEALASNPGYALAWSTLGLLHLYEAMGAEAPDERRRAFERSRVANEKAIRLDPALPQAHARIAGVYWLNDWDFEAAEQSIARALELAPNDSVVMGNAAYLFMTLGRLDEALELQERQVDVDPLAPVGFGNLAGSYYALGRYGDAVAAAEQALALSPGYQDAYAVLAGTLNELGRYDEAREAAAELAEASGNDYFRLFFDVLIDYHSGNQTASDRAMAELVADHCEQNPFLCARAHAYRGELDEAFSWVDRAIEVRDPLATEILYTPDAANLRTDPRYRSTVERIGLPID